MESMEYNTDLFGNEAKNGKKKSRIEIINDYEGFTEKFKPKKTTDDCYTPPAVYDAVLGWLEENAYIYGRKIVRPFYPGGDYEHYDYPAGCIVVDNPPFSIYSKIVRFYLSKGIDFFLFAPSLTQAISGLKDVTYIVTMVDVTYENGAVVRTSFTTNLFPGVTLWACPSLYDRIKAAQLKIDKSKAVIILPDNVITPALMGKWVVRGVELKINASECHPVGTIDEMRAKGKSLFGTGFLISDRAAAERAAADRAAAERAAPERYRLSERERKIIDGLGETAASDGKTYKQLEIF